MAHPKPEPEVSWASFGSIGALTVADLAAGDVFQVLSLDGGGMKGLFSAAVLAEFEADLQVSIIDHFDLVAGTSTGGLVALALGAGLSPSDIVDFYIGHGRDVFGRPRRLVTRLFRPKHDAGGLEKALEDVFGDRKLGESRVRLVIPSYSLERDDVYIFKTPHHEHLARDWRERMVDVALATTAAPTYLAPARIRNTRLIDGGIWANNPALIGLAEATSMLGVPLNQIRVLSLGTTDPLNNLHGRLDRGGLLAWARHGRSLLLRAPALGSFHTVEHLVGKGHAVRIDSVVPDGLFNLDRIDAQRIRGLAEDVARLQSPEVRSFLAHRAGPYKPLHPTSGCTSTP